MQISSPQQIRLLFLASRVTFKECMLCDDAKKSMNDQIYPEPYVRMYIRKRERVSQKFVSDLRRKKAVVFSTKY